MKLIQLDDLVFLREDTRSIVFEFEFDLVIKFHIEENKLKEQFIPEHVRKGLFS
jgi:hypothetical protein